MPVARRLRFASPLLLIAALLGGGPVAQAATPAATVAHSVCATAAPGHATCDAKVAVWRRSHKLVRPHVPARHVSRQRFRTALGARPAVTAQSAPSPGTPAYIQQAYDLSWLSATRGSGDTVGVVDAYDYPTAESDLATYRATFGLPACTTANGCFQKVGQAGAGSGLPAANSGWSTEEALDLDAISALCPNCHIVVVEASSNSSTDLQAAMQTAAAMGAKQISDSWSIASSQVPFTDFSFPGVAVVAATGDSGTLTGGSDSYPAALPGVTAAGGTSLAASGAPRGFTETAWSGAGSGCDLNVSTPSWQAGVGCAGRAYADVSADADPNTGIGVYDSAQGGWLMAGGTSLSAPLIAAYEAVTGVAGTSPQWAYSDRGLLNDSVSGSNGSCLLSVICLAGIGYDGPTGAGSISGAVTPGAPGLGAGAAATAVSASAAAVTAGLYPNRIDTAYYWQYGTTTGYGQQSAAADAGAGAAPVQVSGALPGLAGSTTYHARLVAVNAAGTTYGYDFTFTTPAGSTTAGSATSGSGAGTTSGSSTTSTKTPAGKPAKKSKKKARRAVKKRHVARVAKAKRATRRA